MAKYEARAFSRWASRSGDRSSLRVRDYIHANNIQIPNTETPGQTIAFVSDHAAKGVDGITAYKLSAGRGNVTALPLAIATAAGEAAHRHGMPVFAHPQNLEGVEIAINSGVDVLAHTVPDSPPWTVEFVGRLKRANLALMPTLTLWDFEARKIQGTHRDRETGSTKWSGNLAPIQRRAGMTRRT